MISKVGDTWGAGPAWRGPSSQAVLDSLCAGRPKGRPALNEEITCQLIGAAMAVHREIGPGYRERFYQRALESALAEAGLCFEAQKNLPVYDDAEQQLGFYIPDFIVEDKVIVEIKAFDRSFDRYRGQVITYLNHTSLSIGLLINFGRRSLDWRRVFPSPHTTTFCHNPRWLFVPKWLKAQR